MNNLSFTISDQNQAHEIKLTGALTLMDALEFKSLLTEKEFDTKVLSIDLKQVKDIDLTGLNALLMGKIKLEKEGKILRLITPKEHPIFNLLHLTKFGKQFQIVEK